MSTSDYTPIINDSYRDGTIATRLSCVYVVFYNGCDVGIPPYYIGSTFVDFIYEKQYMGSPMSTSYKSIWKNELKQNRQHFELVILYYFGDRLEALAFEGAIQYNFNASQSGLFVNMCIASDTGMPTMNPPSAETRAKISAKVKGELNPNYGNKMVHSAESIARMVKSRTGLKRSEETKRKMSKAGIASWADGKRHGTKRPGQALGSKNNMFGKKQNIISLWLIQLAKLMNQAKHKIYVTPDGYSIKRPKLHHWCSQSEAVVNNFHRSRNADLRDNCPIGSTFRDFGYYIIYQKDYLAEGVSDLDITKCINDHRISFLKMKK